ncbi:hypothetical protein EDD11_007095 [Mortierella claussenii]|nr:hypothetical protein EDD11_007095 [Mortierella claussenii]
MGRRGGPPSVGQDGTSHAQIQQELRHELLGASHSAASWKEDLYRTQSLEGRATVTSTSLTRSPAVRAVSRSISPLFSKPNEKDAQVWRNGDVADNKSGNDATKKLPHLSMQQFESCMKACFKHIQRWQDDGVMGLSSVQASSAGSSADGTDLISKVLPPSHDPDLLELDKNVVKHQVLPLGTARIKSTRQMNQAQVRPRSRLQAITVSLEENSEILMDPSTLSSSQGPVSPRKCARAKSSPQFQVRESHISDKDASKAALSLETLLDMLAMVVSNVPEQWSPGSVLTEYFRQSHGQGQTIQHLLDQLPTKSSQTIMFWILKVSTAWIDISAQASSTSPTSAHHESTRDGLLLFHPSGEGPDPAMHSDTARYRAKNALIMKLAGHIFHKRMKFDSNSHDSIPDNERSMSDIKLRRIPCIPSVSSELFSGDFQRSKSSRDLCDGHHTESELESDAAVAFDNLLKAFKENEGARMNTAMSVPICQEASFDTSSRIHTSSTPSLTLPPWRTRAPQDAGLKRSGSKAGRKIPRRPLILKQLERSRRRDPIVSLEPTSGSEPQDPAYEQLLRSRAQNPAEKREYNYKSSYWQYKSRQQAKQDLGSEGCSIWFPRHMSIAQDSSRLPDGLSSSWTMLAVRGINRVGEDLQATALSGGYADKSSRLMPPDDFSSRRKPALPIVKSIFTATSTDSSPSTTENSDRINNITDPFSTKPIGDLPWPPPQSTVPKRRPPAFNLEAHKHSYSHKSTATIALSPTTAKPSIHKVGLPTYLPQSEEHQLDTSPQLMFA